MSNQGLLPNHRHRIVVSLMAIVAMVAALTATQVVNSPQA